MKATKRAKFKAALEEVANELTSLPEKEFVDLLESRPMGNVGAFYLATHPEPIISQAIVLGETATYSVQVSGSIIQTFTSGAPIVGQVLTRTYGLDFGLVFDNQQLIDENVTPPTKRFDGGDGDEGSEAA